MPKLLIDANISYRLKKKITTVFEDVLHVTDIDLPQPAKDTEIWQWAKSNSYVIVSYDTDFEIFSIIKGFPPKLILLKIGNQSTQFIADLLIASHSKIVHFEKSSFEGLLEVIY